MAGVLWAVAAEAGHVLLGRNFHAAIPGRVYRCAQPSAADLERAVRRQGIRTVVNLRGCCPAAPWYREEARATHRLNLAQEDICFSAGRLPSIHEMRRLVEVLDRTEYPILIHCRRGADRTGLAAAVALLSQTDASFAEARRQLGPRYGHLAVGRPAYLDQFLDSYERWLGTQGQTHSPAVFRRWLAQDSCPGGYGSTVELLSPPTGLACGQPFVLVVRARNRGTQAWRLCPGSNAGVHAGFLLWDADGRLAASGRAGLFDAVVAPGQSIDLTLAVPALEAPGRYRLWVDMVDEQQCWFFQLGSEPLEQELEIKDEG
jgi:protein tyrosine phosphatase (PTP) superfamily phosphohydrolase (DUF442 family)